MASKQSVTTTKSAKTAAAAPAAAAKPVRTTKPRAPRVSSAKHSKTVAQETAITPAATPVETVTAVNKPVVNKHEAISKIAYGYWIARGYRDGNAHEDWIRAEREFHAAQ